MRTVLLLAIWDALMVYYQYFVQLPLAAITAAAHLGMLSTKFLQTEAGVASPSHSTLSQESRMPFGKSEVLPEMH